MIGIVFAALLECNASSTQLDLNKCALSELTQANALEQRARSAAMRVASGPTATSERRWNDARDAACTFTAAMTAGGSLEPMLELQCKAHAAETRARTLSFWSAPRRQPATPTLPSARAEMQRVYGLLELLVTPAERALLAASQTSWDRYALVACPPLTDLCTLDLVRSRTQELKDSWLAERFW